MRSLHAAAGPVVLDVQVHASQPERDRDRLGRLVGLLHRPRVDDVLMDERRIAVRERVAAQLVVGVPVSVSQADDYLTHLTHLTHPTHLTYLTSRGSGFTVSGCVNVCPPTVSLTP